LTVFIVVTSLTPCEAGLQQLHADFLDSSVWFVSENTTHHLAVGSTVIEAKTDFLVKYEIGYELLCSSRERPGPWHLNADDADLVFPLTVVKREDIGTPYFRHRPVH